MFSAFLDVFDAVSSCADAVWGLRVLEALMCLGSKIHWLRWKANNCFIVVFLRMSFFQEIGRKCWPNQNSPRSKTIWREALTRRILISERMIWSCRRTDIASVKGTRFPCGSSMSCETGLDSVESASWTSFWREGCIYHMLFLYVLYGKDRVRVGQPKSNISVPWFVVSF